MSAVLFVIPHKTEIFMTNAPPAQQPLPPLQQIPADIAALRDYEPYARARMSPQAWAYFSGAAADELTLQANQTAFTQMHMAPRVLRDIRQGSTALQLLGCDLAYPILLAPVAHQRLAHPDAELATALAASAMGAGMVLSTQASTDLAAVAKQASSPLWFQLYIQPDRAFTLNLVQRAEAAGYRALVLTIDAPINGIRNREQRAQFHLPPEVEEVNLRGMEQPRGHYAQPGTSPVFGSGLLNQAPNWDDVRWLISNTRLPVLLKGILNPQDAALAIDAGAAGVIVSNHGGRTLDTLPPTIRVLPAIRAAVPTGYPVLLDGGVRRGTDVFKALALGANAVLLGRPYVYALAAAGAAGVAHVLHMLRAEFEVAMALAGCAQLSDITPEFVWQG